MNASNGHTVVGSLTNLTNGYKASGTAAAKPPVAAKRPVVEEFPVGLRLPNIRARIYDMVKPLTEPVSMRFITEALEKEGYRQGAVQSEVVAMKAAGLLESYGPARGTSYPDLLHLQPEMKRPEGKEYIRRSSHESRTRMEYAKEIAVQAVSTVDLNKSTKGGGNKSIRGVVDTIAAGLKAIENSPPAPTSVEPLVQTDPVAKIIMGLDKDGDSQETPSEPVSLNLQHFELHWRGNKISLEDAAVMHKELGVLVEVLTKMNLLQKG